MSSCLQYELHQEEESKSYLDGLKYGSIISIILFIITIFLSNIRLRLIIYYVLVISSSLLEKDGVFVTDNVLQDGDIIESRFAVERRNRTIHSRMREYLYELKHHKLLETSIIPLGDGVALSTKIREE